MNAAIVEFMVVTGTEWAKTAVAHTDTHRIHKKYTSSSTHTHPVALRGQLFVIGLSISYNTITHFFVDYDTVAPSSF